jgi:hypothetical protein
MAMDLTVSLEDRPGELAQLGEALGNAGVNIEGLCAATGGGLGVVHLLVEDAAGARAAIEAAGMKVEAEAEPIVADLSGDVDRPGTAGVMARKVADAGVNIQVIYTATRDRGVMVTSDNAAARAALGL